MSVTEKYTSYPVKLTRPRGKAVPSSGNGKKLMAHIVPRNEDGTLKDQALCGEPWDRVFNTSKNICPACKKIAKDQNLNALRKARPGE